MTSQSRIQRPAQTYSEREVHVAQRYGPLARSRSLTPCEQWNRNLLLREEPDRDQCTRCHHALAPTRLMSARRLGGHGIAQNCKRHARAHRVGLAAGEASSSAVSAGGRRHLGGSLCQTRGTLPAHPAILHCEYYYVWDYHCYYGCV